MELITSEPVRDPAVVGMKLRPITQIRVLEGASEAVQLFEVIEKSPVTDAPEKVRVALPAFWTKIVPASGVVDPTRSCPKERLEEVERFGAIPCPLKVRDCLEITEFATMATVPVVTAELTGLNAS